MILKANNEIDAIAIIKNNGLIDITPEISLCTKKVFIKDNERFRFGGWCGYKNRKYTEVELIKI